MSSQSSVPKVVDVAKKTKKKFKLTKVDRENYFLLSASLLISFYLAMILTPLIRPDQVIVSNRMLWLFCSVGIAIVINYFVAGISLLAGN